MSPDLSVLIPVCNVEKYLPACLESCMSQSMQNIEIICINDGSTDSSLSILESYAKKDSRIVVIDKANAGYGAAMNDGLRIAQGEYIAILESDDRVCETSWQQLFLLAKQNNLDLIRGNYYQSSENGDVLFESCKNVPIYCPSNLLDVNYEDVFEAVNYPRVFFINPSIWSCLFRRTFLSENNIWFNETPGASFQDASFAFITWAMAKRSMLVDIPVIMYTIDNAGSSVKSTSKVYAVCDEIDYCEKYLQRVNAPIELFQILSALRYKFYAWNRTHIDKALINEFDEKMWKDFSNDIEKGYLSNKFFRRADFEKIIYKTGETPAVSVIVPIHNAEPYLQECLDSVLKQSFTDYELLCVNDGSTDNSLVILREYEAKDNRIKVIDIRKSNAGNARNQAIAKAAGIYLAFLDADDTYEPEMLMTLISLSDRWDLDVALCQSYLYDDSTGEKKNHIKPVLSELKDKTVYSSDDLWGKSFRYAVGWPWDKLFRRSFIESHALEFQELQSTNDAYFVYTALALMDRFAYTQERLVNHRVNNLKSIENMRHKTWENTFKAIEKIHERLIAEDIFSKAERDFFNWVAEMCIWNLRSLHGARDAFYSYVKDNYIEDFLKHPSDYYYDSNYYWRFQVWKSCDLELADSIFKMRDELSDLHKENHRQKEEITNLKSKLNKIKNSKSYKIGRRITNPLRGIKSKLK